jgi:2,3-bisphosphoglycerate-independent phosphoglycerate mutase
MKYILILGDGMSDYPVEILNGKTPLEVAVKPNMDALAMRGEVGLVKTIPDGMKPGSDTANLSVMGYDPVKYYTGRSPLEAISMGINLLESDIAVRANLVTLSDASSYEDKVMLDYSAGEITTAESRQLINFLAKELKSDLYKLYTGISYRHCLVIHNTKLGSDLTPPHDISGKTIGGYLPKGRNGELFLELMKRSEKLLKNHPVNIKRIAEGKNPALSLWFWGEGVRPSLIPFERLYRKRGAVISAVDLLKGIGIAAGMKIYEVRGATGNLHTNFIGKANACLKAIDEGSDFVYVHIEAPDECSHQGDLEGKIKAIELIDKKVISRIVSGLKKRGESYRILVLPDHPTPLITRTHASDPVPYLMYSSVGGKASGATYSEKAAKESGIKLYSGGELMNRFLEII